ncbi:MAG: N-formylglutamate amidohydrolase [Mesorhizobium sp.]|nr:N-formylglutamate amidohydrolase [Mesorhizobium sp.]
MNGARTAVSPVDVTNIEGTGPFVIVCEHASNAVPPEYGGLGLNAATLQSHIAWDPGAFSVARHLSELLDAPLVAQRFSRLLYDCNRPPEAPSSIPAVSEIYRIPGNEGLSAKARGERADRFYHPFKTALSQAIDDRPVPPAIVTIHSFTRIYEGVSRQVEIGILHDDDTRLADAVLAAPGAGGGLVVRRNQPYGPQDGVTHTLREHALPRRLLNVMIEIRNDLIATAENQAAMAERLSGWLEGALAALTKNTGDKEAAVWARP